MKAKSPNHPIAVKDDRSIFGLSQKIRTGWERWKYDYDLKARKREKAAKSVIKALLEQIKAKEKGAREALSKANAIDAAVFDLKAVNPNAVAKVDTRTSEEIIKNIEEQGKILSAALTRLKTLLAKAD